MPEQTPSVEFPDIEKITDTEIKGVFSDLFRSLKIAFLKSYDDTNQSAQWEVDGTETQLRTADAIDMQSNKIINVTDPTAAQDAATKAYADSVAKWEVDGTETQLKTADEIDMRSKAIINLLDPSGAQDASTKTYTDTKISKTTAGEISAMTEKTTLVDADLFLIEDSAAGNAKKKVQKSNIVPKVLSNVIWRSPYLSYKTTDYHASHHLSETSIIPTTEAETTYGEFFGRSITTTDVFEVVIDEEYWLRLSTITTLTFHGYGWTAGTPTLAKIKVTIYDGTNTATSTFNGTAAGQGVPEYLTGTIDVSSLSTSVVSKIKIELSINTNGGGGNNVYCGGIVLLGS